MLSWELVDPVIVSVKKYEGERTAKQNDKIHPMCRDLANQVEWFGKKRSVEDWKDIMASSVKMANNKQLSPVPNNEGGIVVLGLHTSKMTAAEVRDLIEYMYYFGSERKVVWTDPKTQQYIEELERQRPSDEPPMSNI